MKTEERLDIRREYHSGDLVHVCG